MSKMSDLDAAIKLTGEDWYNEYARIQLRENNCDVDPWVALSDEDQRAWSFLADSIVDHTSRAIRDVFT